MLAACDRGTTTAPVGGLPPSLATTSGACQTAPTLISHEFLADGRIRFKWDQQDNLCRLHHWFELRVDATDAVIESGEPFVILNNGLFEYTRSGPLEPGVVHKWRVRNAYGDEIYGPFSSYALFTTPIVTSVTVSPASATINVGGSSVALTATPRDQYGNVMPGKTATWTSLSPSIATVSSTGALTANATGVSGGLATIRATIDGVNGNSTITVLQPIPVNISGPTQIRPGATCTWTAVVSGTPPYTYQWYNANMPVGNGSEYTGQKDPGNLGNTFTIRVDVRDAAYGAGSKTITVTEDPSAPICRF
jgi:hypothetical protein